jgi:fatty acid desaturase
MHGWLNYQIEHHLWPDLSMRQYQQVQPQVKALCEKYGIPYVQESIFRRFGKLWKILLGVESMRMGRTLGDDDHRRLSGKAAIRERSPRTVCR